MRNRFNGLTLDRSSSQELRHQPAEKPLKRFLNVDGSGSPG